MKKYLTLLIVCLWAVTAYTQDIRVNIGPEFLYSLHHKPAYYGVGASAQAEWWVRSTLGLGLNAGYYRHKSTKALTGSNNKFDTYHAIPVLFVLKYPIPIFEGLYGQDMFGYTFAGDAQFQSGKPLKGGITYYFALGYTLKHFDISAKIGRPRFNKKDDDTNVNEHNVGIKVAYVF